MKHGLIVGFGATIIDAASGLVTPTGGSSILEVEAAMLRNGNTDYHGELQYLALLQQLVNKADSDPTPREDRTGTGTYSVFGRQIRFDLEQGFPMLTTKKLFWKGIVAELLWMLSGDTNTKALTDQGVHIWDEWADEEGNLGPVYGRQWRSWFKPPKACYKTEPGDVVIGSADSGRILILQKSIDQIANAINTIKTNPGSRRILVTAWNPADLPDMALSPCHCLFQFYVDEGKLSCQLYQRSADIFLGVPFNIASYALLTQMMAKECGLGLGEFVHTFGDLHLYANHVDQAKLQLSRTPYDFPKVSLVNEVGIFETTLSDVQLIDYVSHPSIAAEVSV